MFSNGNESTASSVQGNGGKLFYTSDATMSFNLSAAMPLTLNNATIDPQDDVARVGHEGILGRSSSTSNGSGDDTICLDWQQCGLIMAFVVLIIVTLIGNTLVILAVLTTRRLRTVTNCFVMSLALADWLVGTFVMPPAVSLFIAGKCVIGGDVTPFN